MGDVRDTIFESGTRLLIVVGHFVQQERRRFVGGSMKQADGGPDVLMARGRVPKALLDRKMRIAQTNRRTGWTKLVAAAFKVHEPFLLERR